jgi:glucuronate isomerase
MPDYLGENFLLPSPYGQMLYHSHAAALPIIDYHCHIDPNAVADDLVFGDITQLWISSDPYKWRAMRMNGVDEQHVTGSASNWHKFEAWAHTVPRTVGNPLFHWTGLELQRFFGVGVLLGPASAHDVWLQCNALLPQTGFSARGLLNKMGVEILCTSDDLLDGLEAHQRMRDSGSPIRMLPSLRADTMVAVGTSGFPAFCRALGNCAGVPINSLDAFEAAVVQRMDHFDFLGCMVADLGMDQPVFAPVGVGDAARHFERLLAGQVLTTLELQQLQTHLLVFAAAQYHRRGWMMQLHIGAHRTTSQRLRFASGGAGGYACIGSSSDVAPVCALLDSLERLNSLPRTVLFTMNPSDTEMFASLAGSFTEAGVPGKLQFGPAWWLNDHRDGIERQLRALGNLGLLSTHIGMTTDSRSLLSYSRHAYYRRILCNLLGSWVDAGELPRDEELLAGMVRDICYGNAKGWLTRHLERAT